MSNLMDVRVWRSGSSYVVAASDCAEREFASFKDAMAAAEHIAKVRGDWGVCVYVGTLKQPGRPGQTVTVGGRTLTYAEWAKVTGVSTQTIRNRIKKGWSPEDAVTHGKGERPW